MNDFYLVFFTGFTKYVKAVFDPVVMVSCIEKGRRILGIFTKVCFKGRFIDND